MISITDSSILAMLSRYPDMTHEEARGHISRMEHEENVPIAEAVVGIRSPESLNSDAKTIYDEFTRWSRQRTERTRNEQVSARQRNKETRLAQKLNDMHSRGLISDTTLVMYGISGSLPDRSQYAALSDREKQSLWSSRMDRRFGPNWRDHFRGMNLPYFIREVVERKYTSSYCETDWRTFGF